NSIRQFELLSRLSPVGAQHRLVVGPWAHAQLAASEVAGIAFPDAAVDETSLIADWMERFAPAGAADSDAPAHAEGWPRAIVYVLGANRWRVEPNWPILGTETRTLALQPDGSASFGPAVAGERTFDYDPLHPYTAP